MKDLNARFSLFVVPRLLSAFVVKRAENNLYVYLLKNLGMMYERCLRFASQKGVRKLAFFVVAALVLAVSGVVKGQNVPISDYSVNNFGQVQLEIQASADNYYLLTAEHESNLGIETITSITMGVDGTMLISEPNAAYPLENYKITQHSIANPDDTDGDGIDDITEFNNMPTDAPLNFAAPISFTDGTTSIPDAATFASMAVVADVPWAPFLNGQEFVKFGILDIDTDNPKVYFINSNTHFIHANFFSAIGANVMGDDGSGEVVFNPNEILPNGAIGSYSFNFSFGDALDFEATQKTFELLTANMPFLRNNMQHFIGSSSEGRYETQYKDDYIGSRINVVLESEVFGDIDFIPFNEAEGYGFFRAMMLDENPGSRDIVLYDALPNSLPRVGGIITSVVQTPLSHVNLRAIQDNAPNAYIRDPLAIDSIADLLGSYIYYKVENDNYVIREATLEEVNDWYEKLRPTEPQIPERDLSFERILPLDSISFEMSTAFGAKCTNVATMRTFGFPNGTIPDGFGIPFYYYDEFMKFNNFYQEVEDMVADPNFISDLETRIDMLKDFRKEIKDAPMPQWMLDDLQAMHDGFPVGTAVRCRSSTNNEDLPGFSGAGLYTSKTQHLDEGHISKSVKQIYASMWNFRAFDERDFYRVDHYIAAMGILCHPNFEEEKSNGVGVSIDPIYSTENTFYLNTQVGEFLITNPDANSIPEEILLNQDTSKGYTVLRESNLVTHHALVMEERFLDSMRNYLKVIHDEFAILYDVVGAEGFGMDIEYKVTAQDQMVIKQARPWVSFWAEIKAENDLGVEEVTEPQTSSSLGANELVTAKVANKGLKKMVDFDVSLFVDGQFAETITVTDTIRPFQDAEFQFSSPQDFSAIGDYDVMAVVTSTIDGYANNDTLNVVLSKLHVLEAGIAIGSVTAKCDTELDVDVVVTNYGETSLDDTAIEVVVNGVVVDTAIYSRSISYQSYAVVRITITENLQATNNQITLNLIDVNGQQDAVASNNTATTTAGLNSSYDIVTVIINADDYPQETSWQIYDEISGETLASGELSRNTEVFSEDICVDYGSCITMSLFDSEGDGICCDYGLGNFLVLNSVGDTLFTNDGEFESEVVELFCPNGEGCAFTARIESTMATAETAADGVIEIYPSGGFGPFLYSIDGGQTFIDKNAFFDLLPGTYSLVVQDDAGNCTYEEMVDVGFDPTSNTNDPLADRISVFPNPVNDQLTIAIEGAISASRNVNFGIYNSLGQLMDAGSISKGGSQQQAVISLATYASGTYIVKCYDESFEKQFKVMKL
ncbi:MAG: PEP/pyruvate-binding domain-containing protein [Saprospiraceae bacterium]